ncbi:fluoride efflux transporter CrcB [Leekyejoonella antrihumi]|uniref:fluoride efflux transporter CrcB n=1 Tax=Leekyejoonella antrihumi TaxID=1660198 RepID=UPI001C97D8BA|nr:fluoride efflux transporter CrcB [Leekyejoonella antrihumi]
MNDPSPFTAAGRVDPDGAPPTRRERLLHHQALPVAVIACGGAVGAVSRYAVGLAWPTTAGHFPVSTLLINVIGCAIMGVFMVLITQKWQVHPLVRPFFGTGVLGGFTTFSTYEVDAQHLLQGGHWVTALAYLVATLAAAVFAVWAAETVTRLVVLDSTGAA